MPIEFPKLRKNKEQKITDVPPLEYQAEEKGWMAGVYDFRKGLLPGCDYFNPSLVKRGDETWLVVRCSRRDEKVKIGINSLVAFLLKDNIPQFGWPISIPKVHPYEHHEDPRSILHNGKIILSCCHFWMPTTTSWTGARVLFAEVSNPDSKNGFGSKVRRIDCAFRGNGQSVQSKGRTPEKNWLQFSRDGKIHVVYSASPGLIFEMDDTGKVLAQHESNSDLSVWKFGTIRGGTPPVKVGDEYITFFHSSTPWTDTKRQYHMGAYAFESKPPFRITKITAKPLLSGSRFDLWFRDKPLVVFPCGALPEKNNEWLISYGINDLLCGWVKIPHASLPNLLTPVG